MNLDRESALGLARAVQEHVGDRDDVQVALFTPAVYLAEIVATLAGSPVVVGAQNCSDHESGAFTGEISAAMIRDVGATSVLIGHSERRHVFGESDALIAGKLRTALAAGLEVVLCIGETLEEREAGETEKVCARQLGSALSEIPTTELASLSLAYEPVWAIGTGHTATPAQAQTVHAYVRGLYAGLSGSRAAENLRILYGGSVKPDNARDLLGEPDIDGALVGGAALAADSFLPIITPDVDRGE